MHNKRTIFLAVATFLLLLMAIEPAIAGPGGKIASAAFETFWGRVILGILTIVFLPLIAYVMLREKIAERRTRKDLRFMAAYKNTKIQWWFCR